MGLKLFDDDGNTVNDDISNIEINDEFARRYEHNKKREDLQKYAEMKKKGVVDDSASEEDESEEDDYDSDVLEKNDVRFFDALIKVKKQDPVLKQKDVTLFVESDEEEEDDSGGEDEGKVKKRKKAMYLKDVVAKHLIEEGPDFEDKVDGKKSYNEEQEELRREFLKAAGGLEEDGEGDFLRVKDAEDQGNQNVDGGEEFGKKLDEYFGEGEVDENAKFLKEYFMNKLWIDKDLKVEEQELDELSDDEEQLEKQEEYEKGYNFRFEENAGDRVLGHSRIMEGSVRKKTNARKDQRKNKEERMKIAEMQREEELKHLKNVKKEEMEKKLRKIAELAGIGEDEILLNARDLDKDFDPDDYDRIMKAAFDEKYYNEEDADEEKLEKPDFEKEDELLGLPKDWDAYESKDGFLAAREKILKMKADIDSDTNSDAEGGEEGEEAQDAEQEDEEDEDAEQEDEEDEMVTEEVKKKRKRKMSVLKKAKEEMLEEYYKLDYEDTIGDLKIRFPYAKIKPNRYGLSTEEIIMMDDKELNQYVPLKKIVPYQEQEWKVHNSKRHQQKIRSKELLKEKLDDRKSSKKKRKESDDQNISKKKMRESDDQNISKKIRSKELLKEKLDDRKSSKKKRKGSDDQNISKKKMRESDDQNISKKKSKETDDKKISKKKKESDGQSLSKKKRTMDDVDKPESEKSHINESNGDIENLSRKAKRRHRAAELKLSQSRLLAYGKISAKGKRKSE